jgi:hypothetical protein
VRVRLTAIDNADLNLFEFDYDLTFMVFFLDAQENVYARYGGRDAENPDSRQSPAGLRYTMASVLQMHHRADKDFAPRSQEGPQFLRNSSGFRRGRCLHCHQVRETQNADLQKEGKWSREQVWRYPLPENLGFRLEVDRGNMIQEVKALSPASGIRLAAGDVLRQLNGVPVHSFADAQYALDRAPKAGSIAVVWQRGDKVLQDKLVLPEGWRRTDISWRPSMRHVVASARLYGTDLKPEEKKALGLSAQQLAFRQRGSVPAQARAAGIQPGDVILGIDDKSLETDVTGFLHYVQRNYLVGDQATINLLRDGKRLNVTMTFLR